MRKLVRFIFIAEIIILLLLYSFYIEEFNIIMLTWIVGIAIFDAILIIHVQNKLRVPIKYRLISTLFIIGYLIVFYQRYVDLILGNISVNSKIFASPGIIIKCCLISTIGLASFGIGYLSSTKRQEHHPKQTNEVVDLKGLRILFFLTTIVYLVFNMRKIVSGSYNQEALEAEAGTMVLYSDIFFQLSLVVLISYVVKNQLRNAVSFIQFNAQFGWVSVFCLLFYCFANVIIGDRGPVIICLSIYFGAYFLISKKALNTTKLIVGIILAILFFSLLGQLRQKSRSDRFQNIGVVLNNINEKNSILPFTMELAGSVNTLHYSVYYVPDKHPYTYALFPIRAVVSAVPFGDRLFFSIWPLPKRYISSAFFVTWLIQGDYYTYGNGTSCNADLYLSFGIVGIIVGLWLWGLFIRFLENRITWAGVSTNLTIVYLFTCGYSIYVNRAYLLSYLNFCVFGILLNFIYHQLFIKK